MPKQQVLVVVDMQSKFEASLNKNTIEAATEEILLAQYGAKCCGAACGAVS